MSSEMSAWAFDQVTPEPIDKLVLIIMADGTPPDGWWNGSIPRLATKCGMTEEAVEASLHRMAQADIIRRLQVGYQLAG